MTDKIFSILDDAKTEDIKIIDLRNKSSVADYFIISTCRSSRHADATADELAKQLKKNHGNVSKTADFIGMERSALHRKLKSLGIKGIN